MGEMGRVEARATGTVLCGTCGKEKVRGVEHECQEEQSGD